MNDNGKTLASLTGVQQRILTALSKDEWLSRTDISKAMGRKRALPYDIQQLDELVELGYVERRQQKIPGYIPFMFVYRLRQ